MRIFLKDLHLLVKLSKLLRNLVHGPVWFCVVAADKKPVSPTDNIGVLASVHAPPRTESSPDR